ncbi:MAG: DUF1499 domain-containing protein [Ilumatobacter sp.]
MMIVLFAALAAALATVGGAIGVRRAGDDPAEWHVDPLTSPNPDTPNWYRLSPADSSVERHPERDAEPPLFSVSAAELGDAFDAVAIADDRVEVLAGSAAEGHVTYVQRSALFAFPDYVSVRFIDLPEGGSTLSVFSRARFGKSDFNVNQKRVERWLAATRSSVS